jgi:folate-binding Fe-S cluster repair protein YgfZ
MFCHLKNRILTEISGPKTIQILQNLTTNQINNLQTGLFCAFLSPKGRILFDSFVYKLGDEKYLIECEALKFKEFEKHLKKYLLRSQVSIKKSEFSVWQGWDFNENYKDLSIVRVNDPRSNELGTRFVMPPGVNLDSVEQEQYKIKRILLGIPEGPDDFVYDTSLPLELNLDKSSGGRSCVYFS